MQLNKLNTYREILLLRKSKKRYGKRAGEREKIILQRNAFFDKKIKPNQFLKFVTTKWPIKEE